MIKNYLFIINNRQKWLTKIYGGGVKLNWKIMEIRVVKTAARSINR